MRRTILVVGLLLASPGAALAQGIGGFGTGLMNGYYQGQAQRAEIQRLQICNRALQIYENGGPPPPPLCMAPPPPTAQYTPPSPPRPSYTTCLPFGDGGMRCTTH